MVCSLHSGIIEPVYQTMQNLYEMIIGIAILIDISIFQHIFAYLLNLIKSKATFACYIKCGRHMVIWHTVSLGPYMWFKLNKILWCVTFCIFILVCSRNWQALASLNQCRDNTVLADGWWL